MSVDGLLKMDGFDDCIAGLVERCGAEPIVCYDKDKVLAKLEEQMGSREDALEWYEFNQLGAWVGDRTPCFLDRDLVEAGL
jgi:hypothetical protein